MSNTKERTTIRVRAERAVLAAVRLPDSRFDQRDPFAELTALAEQAGAVVVGHVEQRRQKPESATYMGSGKIEELRSLCEAMDASMVIFDHDLSPRQIGNVERAIERKVVDRSELILDIFASRATTHEAKMQVELAQLEYTYPRLRAMWSHLERIAGTGGIGGIGTRGPGEQQIEIDRRLVQRRKLQLQRELEEIHGRKQRAVQKRKRDNFTVGLVGYTNAGKSTLFNTLTEGGAYADDRLFATLMTRTRDWNLGGGLTVMLSDTVGFVRDIPPHLIASFRATLEEATHADLLLIVIDVSDPAAELHYQTVVQTLDDLDHEIAQREDDEEERRDPPVRAVLLNKIDLLADNREMLIWQRLAPDAIQISALPTADGSPGEGHEAIIELVRRHAIGEIRERELVVDLSDSRTITTLENRAEVLDRKYETGAVRMRIRVGSRQLDQLRSAGAKMRVVDSIDEHDSSTPGWSRASS